MLNETVVWSLAEGQAFVTGLCSFPSWERRFEEVNVGLRQTWAGLVDGLSSGRCGDCVLSECAHVDSAEEDRIASQDVI